MGHYPEGPGQTQEACPGVNLRKVRGMSTSLLRGKAQGTRVAQPEEEEDPEKPHCSLSVPTVSP